MIFDRDTAFRAAVAFGVCSLVLFWVLAALARDDGRYSNSPHKPWFDAQKNGNGTSCCHEADAHRYDENYTINPDGSVTLGDGRTLPAYMVLKGINPTGSAIYWYREYDDGRRTDYCFSPGTMM